MLHLTFISMIQLLFWRILICWCQDSFCLSFTLMFFSMWSIYHSLPPCRENTLSVCPNGGNVHWTNALSLFFFFFWHFNMVYIEKIRWAKLGKTTLNNEKSWKPDLRSLLMCDLSSQSFIHNCDGSVFDHEVLRGRQVECHDSLWRNQVTLFTLFFFILVLAICRMRTWFNICFWNCLHSSQLCR